MSGLNDSAGKPFFTNVTKIAEEVSVGMLAESPAVLVGNKFVHLSAPEAKLLSEKIRELAA